MSIHYMQGPYADSFYNQSPMKMMGNPETK
jgi:hypothetical protein